MNVNKFDEEAVVTKIEKMLSNNHKIITDEQRAAIIANCKISPNPLLIEFLVSQALHWKSYTNVSVSMKTN